MAVFHQRYLFIDIIDWFSVFVLETVSNAELAQSTTQEAERGVDFLRNVAYVIESMSGAMSVDYVG